MDDIGNAYELFVTKSEIGDLEDVCVLGKMNL
jgi:hypothetical protein